MRRTRSKVLLSILFSSLVCAATAAVVITIWVVLINLLTVHQALPSGRSAALMGFFAGALIRLLQRYRKKASLRVTGVTALCAAIWLIASGFRPSRMDSVNIWGIAGSIICWLVITLTVDDIFRTISFADSAQSQIVKASVRVIRSLGFLIFIAIVLFPFYFMLISSLKPRAEFLQNPGKLNLDFTQGGSILFSGYREVLLKFNFGRYILNSTFVAFFTVIFTLIPAILGAYAVTRLHFPGRNLLSKSILLIYMFPAIVLVIPLYSVFSQLGLRNSLPGLLVVYPAMTIPVALYMLRSYFLTLPKDIEEAGIIDGCSRFEVIWRITIPLSIPALASVALYVFMIAWNEFLFAFMFLDSPDIFTLSRGVVSLNSQEVPRQFLMAGAVIITVPVMSIFIWFERFLSGGLVAGGVKG